MSTKSYSGPRAKGGSGKGITIQVVDAGLAALFIRVDKAAAILPSEIGVIGGDAETGYIARVHEEGRGNNPQRSFLRATMAAGRKRYAALSKRAYGKFLDGSWSLQQAMMAVAVEVKSDIQARILRGIAPALQAETVDSKRRAGMPKPRTALFATGKLFNSIRVRLPKWAGGGDAL